jgi:hypothetical protein
MRPLRESLSRLLEAHQPNPALIVDGLWNLIEANAAASLLWDGVDPALLEAPMNILRLAVHPDGLPSISSMTAACNAPLSHQLRRKNREDADQALGELIDEIESYLPAEPPAGPVTQPVVSLELHTAVGDVSLFTISATWERRSRSPPPTWRSRRSCPLTRSARRACSGGPSRRSRPPSCRTERRSEHVVRAALAVRFLRLRGVRGPHSAPPSQDGHSGAVMRAETARTRARRRTS